MNQPTLLDLTGAAERIASAARIIITTHVRADGDAVGSALAMQRVLRQQGRTATVYLHETILDRYAFLAAGAPPPVWNAAAAGEILAGADLLLIVDTCAAEQLRGMAEPIRRARIPKLAIDHHVTRDDIADAILLDTEAGACAQIVTGLCDHAGWKIDRETADMLFTGLTTDTGWFRFSNADSPVFTTGARLIEAGARPNELYERLYLNDCEARARLAGYVLSSFELLAEGRLAVIRLTREAIARGGATREMTEDLINEPQRVGSVVACLLLVEPETEGPVRVSFRSKRGVDVAALAARFGGGGHERAAGARIAGTMESVAGQVIPLITDSLKGVQ